MKRFLMLAFLTLGLAGGMPDAASANDFAPKIREAIESKVRPWLKDPLVVNAIKAQNQKHASLTDADIDKLDKTWRAEAKAGGGPLVDSIMKNDLSKFLKAKQNESNGVFSEVFIMDNKGLNVGSANVTTDYMQGDEAKWKNTYMIGPNAVFIDEVEFDDSSKQFQSQASVTIVDPADGKVIGAITIGFNVEKL